MIPRIRSPTTTRLNNNQATRPPQLPQPNNPEVHRSKVVRILMLPTVATKITFRCGMLRCKLHKEVSRLKVSSVERCYLESDPPFDRCSPIRIFDDLTPPARVPHGKLPFAMRRDSASPRMTCPNWHSLRATLLVRSNLECCSTNDRTYVAVPVETTFVLIAHH